MKNQRFLCVLAGAAVLAGCGGSKNVSGSDLCNRADGMASSLKAKIDPCAITMDSFDKAKCTAATASCSSSDLSTLNSTLDCLDALPACTVATKSAFETSMDACEQRSSGVSAACRAALDQSSGTDASTVCQKAGTVFTALSSRSVACGGPSVTFNAASCTAAAASCSSSDLSTLDAMLDCLNALPTCPPASLTEFNAQGDACEATMSSTSSACQAAFH